LFLVAVQFLTRLPSPIRTDPDPAKVGESIAWFPVVGLLIGVILVSLDQALNTFLDFPVVNAILVWILVAIAGALHLDGLIDTADGLSAASDPGGRLDAMRESTTRGPGAMAACCLILLIYAALSGLAGGARPMALLIAPTIGRAAIVLGYRTFPYPRTEATVSRWLKDSAASWHAGAALVATSAFIIIMTGLPGLALVALATIVALGLGRALQTLTSGVTGDGHGAICEITQLAVLLGAPLVFAR